MVSWRPRHTMYLQAVLYGWGDRMWAFAIGLYMMLAAPESFRLTAVYGFVTSASVLLLGAPIGRWVDRTHRLKAAQVSLVVQNSCVAACAGVLVVSIEYRDFAASTTNRWLLVSLQVLVIFLADVAALASLAYRITIEKDWVVVISDGDNDKLAWMNSTFRSIDLTTMILAPVLVGQLMTFFSAVVAAVFMALWNLVSMGVEFLLLRVVYQQVPRLSRDKAREEEVNTEGIKENPAEHHRLTGDHGLEEDPHGSPEKHLQSKQSPLINIGRKQNPEKPRRASLLEGDPVRGPVEPHQSAVSGVMLTLQDISQGWSLYFSLAYRWAGLALASLYMTVLGFDNITVGYGMFLGLSESTISIMTACGAVLGISGSLCFPRLRVCLGLTKCGLLGFSLAVGCQMISLVSVFLPGTPFEPFAKVEHKSAKLSVIVFYVGIISARFGLWVGDLSVTQLLQQTVSESRRGSVAGVQDSINMLMDSLKFALVVAFPQPQLFGYLMALSVLFWIFGWLLYVLYIYTHGCSADSVSSGQAANQSSGVSTGDQSQPDSAIVSTNSV